MCPCTFDLLLNLPPSTLVQPESHPLHHPPVLHAHAAPGCRSCICRDPLWRCSIYQEENSSLLHPLSSLLFSLFSPFLSSPFPNCVSCQLYQLSCDLSEHQLQTVIQYMQQVFRCFSKLLPQVMNFSIFSSSYPSFLQHHSAVLWCQGSPQCKYEHFFLFNYYFFSFLIVLEKHAYLNLRERQARLIILMKISVPIFTA